MAEESVAQMLARAIQAAREKQRVEARELLLRVIERDERNEQAWLWLSGVMDDPRDMQVALANALTINPAGGPARKGLDMLRQRYGNLLNPEEEPPPAAEAAPPPPSPAPAPATAAAEEETIAFQCYSCKSEVYNVADFCWSCHAVIHCCENCTHRREMACKEEQGIRGPAAAVVRNRCLHWVPATG